jgi:AraC-like DNA-binding protein
MAQARGLSRTQAAIVCVAAQGDDLVALVGAPRCDRLPLKRIAHQSGLGDAANLRRRFRAALGISPHAQAERFSHPETQENGAMITLS